MKGRPDIWNELETISKIVAEIPKVPVFTVPQDYFDRFPDQMLLMIRESAIDDQPAAELSRISPLLAGISKKMPQQVPEGYFDTIKPPASDADVYLAPVVPMRKKGFSMFAIAATVIALLGFATLLFFQMRSETSTVPVNLSAEFPKLSEQEMNEFLHSFPDPGISEPIPVATGEVNVEQMIGDINDNGLQEFLSDMPETQTEKLN